MVALPLGEQGAEPGSRQLAQSLPPKDLEPGGHLPHPPRCADGSARPTGLWALPSSRFGYRRFASRPAVLPPGSSGFAPKVFNDAFCMQNGAFCPRKALKMRPQSPYRSLGQISDQTFGAKLVHPLPPPQGRGPCGCSLGDRWPQLRTWALRRRTSGEGPLDAAGSGGPALPGWPWRVLMGCDHLALWSQRSAAQAVGSQLQGVVRLGAGKASGSARWSHNPCFSNNTGKTSSDPGCHRGRRIMTGALSSWRGWSTLADARGSRSRRAPRAAASERAPP